MTWTPPKNRLDVASLPGNIDIINHIRNLKSIEDVHAYCNRLLASRFEDQDGDEGSAGAGKDGFEAYKERVAAANPPPKFITIYE